MVNILAFSDIHEAEISRREHEELKRSIDKDKISLVVSLGDMQKRTLEYLARLFSEKNIPIFAVRGNHDSYSLEGIPDIVNMHQKVVGCWGITIAGLEGCLKYTKDPYTVCYSDEDYTSMIGNFRKITEEGEIPIGALPKVDILITHCPPIGQTLDTVHDAPPALRNLMMSENSPRLAIHGHLHKNYEANEVNRDGKAVRIIGAYPSPRCYGVNTGRLISLNNEKVNKL